VPASIDELTAIALAHAAAEALDDPAPVMETLEDDCVYELQPVGLVLEGLEQARRYYDYFFSTFRHQIAGYTMRSEWRDERGVGQEYTIWTRTGPGGALERHEIVGVLTFGRDKLSGERLYASERLLRMMFGPVLEDARPIEVGQPEA